MKRTTLALLGLALASTTAPAAERVSHGVRVISPDRYTVKIIQPKRASAPACRERFNANDCSAIRGCDWIRTSTSGAFRCARVTY
jgi:hypothetical protein